MFNDVIYLISKQRTKNEVGDLIYEKIKTMRFAQVKSIGQAEFYQAQSQGLKPEIKFVLADYLDYQNQEEIVYNDFVYKVLRTYRQGNEIEIVCHGGVKMEVFENVNSE